MASQKQGGEVKRPKVTSSESPSVTYGRPVGKTTPVPRSRTDEEDSWEVESSGSADMEASVKTTSTATSILVYSGATGGTIDPAGALKTSIPVSTTGGQALVTNPASTTTGGLSWSSTGGKATPVNVPPALNPTGVTGSTLLMQGLGSTLKITPSGSGNVFLSLDMTATNGTSSDGVEYALAYGTGTAPANGAAAAGTIFVPLKTLTTSTTVYPVGLSGVALGLTVGTAYWFDIQLAATTGGTATLAQITGSVIEV